MRRINASATSVSRKEIHKLTNPDVELDSEWLEAPEIWAADPDMILILEGPCLIGGNNGLFSNLVRIRCKSSRTGAAAGDVTCLAHLADCDKLLVSGCVCFAFPD
jgi:hypothetical protein